ncbi:MAG: hypothetical protein R6X34_17865 [Chloroflexota bacterium]
MVFSKPRLPDAWIGSLTGAQRPTADGRHPPCPRRLALPRSCTGRLRIRERSE